MTGLTWWTPCQWLLPQHPNSPLQTLSSAEEEGKAFVAISRANAAISTHCRYIWLSAAGEPVEFALAAGSGRPT